MDKMGPESSSKLREDYENLIDIIEDILDDVGNTERLDDELRSAKLWLSDLETQLEVWLVDIQEPRFSTLRIIEGTPMGWLVHSSILEISNQLLSSRSITMMSQPSQDEEDHEANFFARKRALEAELIQLQDNQYVSSALAQLRGSIDHILDVLALDSGQGPHKHLMQEIENIWQRECIKEHSISEDDVKAEAKGEEKPLHEPILDTTPHDPTSSKSEGGQR